MLPETFARFTALEAAKDYDNPEYGARIAMEEYYPQIICRFEAVA